MRHFLLASITTALLCGPAFGGAPAVPAVPPVPAVPSVNVSVPATHFTVNTLTDVNPGTSSNTTVHGGPVTLSQSMTLKMSVLIGSSTSVYTPGINVGFTVP